ncbi:NAD(P)H-binding protein [Dactylosporangium salmoneum]|uniref:SDR family oxidoreductase n=1 Tax=Dactylosporangium salmoneum TaxID=53361 RepID=A0ABN3G4X2_9ACTN
MIIVTGANGPFGRLVAEHLARLVPAGDIAVSVRDAGKAEPPAGVQVRTADFGAPESLPKAFEGAGTVFVNATYYGTPPEVRAGHMRSALDAAVAAGARRIVVTSWADAGRSTIPSTLDFARTERLVEELPVDWTIVRVGYGLAAALARDVIAGRRDGVLTAPAGNAALAVGATADQAEAVARILTTKHDKMRYDLTGPDTVGWDELAAMAGVEYRPEPEAAYRARCLRAGFPERAADQLLDLYAAIRSGWAGTPTGDLERLLGRHPVLARAAVREAVDGWAW